ncbi:MAG TPA: hypothetical protein VLE96_05635 [Chlamydiales bacterium]|nr:hypothetical protein [Chlamydiales bacterium]
MKKLLLLSFVCMFSLLIGQSLYFFRDGFSLRRLQSDSSSDFGFIDEETHKILQQPFHYLGRGRQCFAFASEDGKYVLKCIRTDKFKVPFWTQMFPRTYKNRKEKIAQKKQLVFESFRIANEELKEQTGTIALHLGKSKSKQKIAIFDSLGIRHQIPLDNTLFILQYKRPLWSTVFQNSKCQEKKQLLDTFIELVANRSKMGIINRDPHFLPNYGFENGKTYQIDIGDFRRDPDCNYQKAMRDSLSPVQAWLAKTDPTMLNYLNERLKRL